MQVNENINLLIKTDLLLHEKEFNALRNFIQNSNQSNFKNNDCIDYSDEENCITITPLITNNTKTSTPKLILENLYPQEQINKISSGYILLTICSLKKLLSL